MKVAVPILISLLILAILALVFFSPGLTEALAMVGLTIVCVVVAKNRGIKTRCTPFPKGNVVI
jgi:hypothetical protein